MRELVIPIRTAAGRLGFAVGRRRTLRSHVVLATSRSEQIGGNLLFIERELTRRDPPIPVVVLATRTSTSVVARIAALWQAVRAGYHLATARLFVVDDYYYPMYVVSPRPGTLRAQVWHAAGAFKKFGYSVLEKSFGVDEDYVRRVTIHANYDVCLVSSASVVPFYMEAFRQPRERFTASIGVPRTDLLFDPGHRERATAAVRARYSLPADRRVLLYAPTFRGERITDARSPDALDLTEMCDALAAGWVLLLRLHPFVRRTVTIPSGLADFVVDVSDWPDINELMLVADLLVSDYSSAIYEFALLERPMAFLAPDFEAFERERGLYFDYRSGVPGPIFETTAELAAYVLAGEFDVDRARAFARLSFDMADGRASERFVDRVAIPALRGEPPRLEPEGTRPASPAT